MKQLSKVVIPVVISLILSIPTTSFSFFFPTYFPSCQYDCCHAYQAPYCRCCFDDPYYYTQEVDNACVDFCVDYEHSLEYCEKACTR